MSWSGERRSATDAAGSGRHRPVSYCEELRGHLDEFVETRWRLLIALGVVAAIGLALLIAGRPTMAAAFGLAPSAILGLFATGNELMARRTARTIATDCPETAEHRDP